MSEAGITWGDVVLIVGLVVTIVVPIIKLNVNISKLTSKLESIGVDLTELTSQNSKTHSRIFTKLDQHDVVLNDHDKRISILEHDKKE